MKDEFDTKNLRHQIKITKELLFQQELLLDEVLESKNKRLNDTIFMDNCTVNGLDCIMAYIPKIKGSTIEVRIADESSTDIINFSTYTVL